MIQSKVVLLLSVAGLAFGQPPREPQVSLDASQVADLRNRVVSTPFRLDRSMNQFSSALFNQFSQTTNGNLLYSPFSLHTALSMTYIGSPQNSRTNQELGRALGLQQAFARDYPTNYLQLLNRYDNLRRSHDTKVQFANKIYSDETFDIHDNFVKLLNIFFRTTQEKLDFADVNGAVRNINGFVRDQTNRLIPMLMSPADIDSFTRMVLVNAIYFKANWKTQFKPRATKEAEFTIGDETFTHRAMTTQGKFGVASFDGFKVLELPYEDEDIVMYVVLPDDDSDIVQVGSQFRNLNFKNVDRKLEYGKRKVQFPKFKFGYKESQMTEILKALGIRDLFSESAADLSDISDESGIYVSSVVHEAKLEVNEEGSEAAAATAVAVGTRTFNKNNEDFIVDRPFLIVIHDKQFNIPLFVGRIVDPTGGKRQLNIHSKREIDSEPQLPLIPEPLVQEQRQLDETIPVDSREEETQTLDIIDELVPEILGEDQTDEEDLPPCPSILGYLFVNSPNVSFPCKGRDTLNLEAFRRRQLLLEEIRRARFLQKQLQYE